MDDKKGPPINLNTILTSVCLAGILYVGSAIRELTIAVVKLETKESSTKEILTTIAKQYNDLNAAHFKLERRFDVHIRAVSGDEPDPVDPARSSRSQRP
jgi:hypothetical protein